VGVNLEPGLNTTVATITTPTYSSGVAGLNGVVMIVFAAMRSKRPMIVALGSNPHRITLQIRGSLNPARGMVIAELSRKLASFWARVETRRSAPFGVVV